MEKILVNEDNFDEAIKEIADSKYRSFDTETTGLHPFKGDRLFSAIFCIEKKSFYFNFKEYTQESKPLRTTLPRSSIRKLSVCFEAGVTFMHNAKFDWHMVEMEEVEVKCIVWDTMLVARLLYNDYMKYDLASCAERIGEKKDDAVEKYIKENKLWEWVSIPGKKSRKKNKFYDQVPFDIIVPYGFRDSIVTYKLGRHQMKEVSSIQMALPQNKASFAQLVDYELMCTRVCKDMENTGILVDRKYCEDAITHEEGKLKEAITQFKNRTKFDFKDSNKELSKIFTALGMSYPLTAKGNPCFNDEALSKITGSVPSLIKDIRKHEKRMNTYFRSYLYFAEGGAIHPSMHQGGTATGRFSYSEPNLQNIPKDDKGSNYPVRRAFIPREDYKFVSIDYDQMEFRLMLDYAKEEKLIERIIKGHDPHQSTADLVGLGRREAKTLNFGLLYGMGVQRLADTLGVSYDEASKYKKTYFSGLRNVQRFLRGSTNVAKARGRVYDWLGRTFHFANADYAYKSPNAIIQGGCASIVKIAMFKCSTRLKTVKSRMILQIHDEILFEIHKDELYLIPELVKIMEDVYPYKMMPMKCSVEWSARSFGDLEAYGG